MKKVKTHSKSFQPHVVFAKIILLKFEREICKNPHIGLALTGEFF